MKILPLHATNRGRAAFTLLELSASLALLFVIFASLAMFVQTSDRAQSEGRANLALEARGRRTIDRMVDAIRQAEATSISPLLALPSNASSIEFQVSLGDQAGAVAWGSPERIALDAATGKIVWTENPSLAAERSVVWCSDVAASPAGEDLNGLDDDGNGYIDERGLAFAVDGQLVSVLLCLEDPSPGGAVRRQTFTATVRCRN